MFKQLDFFSETVSFLLSCRSQLTSLDSEEESDNDCQISNNCDNDAVAADIVVKIETSEDLQKVETFNGEIDNSQTSLEEEVLDGGGRELKKNHSHRPPVLFCTLCGVPFPSRKELRQHRKEEHAARIFPLKKCRRKSVTDAMPPPPVGPEEETVFQCEFCAKSFNSGGGLSKHLKIHSGLKPYRCVLKGTVSRVFFLAKLTLLGT